MDPRVVTWSLYYKRVIQMIHHLFFVLTLFSVMGWGLMVFHVPRNNALATIDNDPMSGGAASQWLDYVTSWTAWNHVWTVAAVLGTAALSIALRY